MIYQYYPPFVLTASNTDAHEFNQIQSDQFQWLFKQKFKTNFKTRFIKSHKNYSCVSKDISDVFFITS